MAIDVGLFYENRRHLQNTADAAALAGVGELPVNPAAATAKATEWAAKNGVPSRDIKTIEVRTTDYPNDTLFVEVQSDFSWIFGRVLGRPRAR
jgi:Flp pilus assembly protein TadG